MEKLFGTDGIRGKANQHPMTIAVATAMGVAVAHFIQKHNGTRLIIGRDTRRSGPMLEAALAAGAASCGIDVDLAGVIPTPGVAFLVADTPAAGAGVVISASHNPYYDNGLKVFKTDGTKLTDAEEAALEADLLALLQGPLLSGPAAARNDASAPASPEPGTIAPLIHAHERYAAFLKKIYADVIENNASKPGLPPISIVIDCANGAAHQIARQVFTPPHFNARFIHTTPDGININNNCGSQHTQDLAREVINQKAQLGLAFDGDADRLIALDETGTEISGDKILAICATHAAGTDALPHNRVVSTVMSNIGLGKALSRCGIDHVITDVGDRRVMQAMTETGAAMGGEDSGHMIFSRHHTTGDGMLTALMLVSVMVGTGFPASRLASIMTVYPQILKNVTVSVDKPDFMSISPIAQAIQKAEVDLGDKGRVLVRYSGTQPLLRVMVEGAELGQTKAICDDICDVVRSEIGK